MSFSKAPLKRFNEHVGCAPAPGIYEIKPGEPKGAASFNRSDRFKPPKTVAGSSLAPRPSSPSRHPLVSPVRRTLSVDVLSEGSTLKKGKQSMTFEKKLTVQLENEIRTLVQQRGEQDRRFLSLEEESKKVEAKLLASLREKTALGANVQTLERQKAELKKVNDFLKNKVSADTTKKRIHSLTTELMEARNNLDSKNKELNSLQGNTRDGLKKLEGDLRTANKTITSLKDKRKDLDDLYRVTKNINEELESENARLQAVVQELTQEVKVLQGYLDAANEQIQDLRLKLEKTSAEESQQDRIKDLEIELEQRITELLTTEDLLTQKKSEALKCQQDLEASRQALDETKRQLEEKELELRKSQDSAIDLEEQLRVAKQDVLDSQGALLKQEKEVLRFREALRRTEQELDERVAHMEQKWMLSEEEKKRTQVEDLRRVEELKAEVNRLMKTINDEQTKRFQLEQLHEAVSEELAKEKALVDSLSVLFEQEKQDSEEKFKQLEDEMEEVLGELSLMENAQSRLEVMEKSQEACDRLQEEKEERERELCDAKELLNKKDTEHSSAMMDLQDAHLTSLNKIQEVLTELESTKKSLSAAEEKQKSLEVEAERVNLHIKDLDRVVEQKEELIKRVTGDLEEQQKMMLEEREAWERKAETVQMTLSEKEKEVEAFERLQEEKEELKTELCDAKELLKKKDTEHSSAMMDLQDTHLTSLNKIQEVLTELESTKKSLSAAEEKQKSLEVEAERVNLHIKDLDRVVEQKEELMKRVTGDLEEQQKMMLEEREAWERKAETVQMTLSEKEKEVEAFERLQEEKEELEKELCDAKELLNKKDTEHSSAMIDLQDAHLTSLNKIQEVLTELESTKKSLSASEEKQKSLEVEAERVNLHIKDMDRVVEQKEELMKRVTGDLEEQQKMMLEEREAWERKAEVLQMRLAEKEKEFRAREGSQAALTRELQQKLQVLIQEKEQLVSFASERNALLSENGANQDELSKLADAYSRLLGHQNQKQKIKHIMKLKDENLTLKQELSKLRRQVKGQKCDLDQLKEKLPGGPRHRFDPSKAFQHDKENQDTETAGPLREGNHCM